MERWVHPPPESMPSKTGNLHPSFAGASAGFKMAQLPAEEFKQPLRLIMLKAGLRAANIPHEEERSVLIAHILKHYGNHTPEEIVLAFDLAITHQLDLEENEIPCYENFSCAYFSRIMDAYRRWAAPQLAQLDRATAAELPPSKMTAANMHRWILDQAVAVGKDRKNPELLPVELYDWMIETRKIAPSTRSKWVVAERAVARRQAWLVEQAQNGTPRDKDRLSDFMSMKCWGFEGAEKKIIQDLGKRIILWEYLNNFYQIFLFQHNGTTV